MTSTERGRTMTYNSKRTISSMSAGLILVIAYLFYALGGSAPGPEDLKSWAIHMLIFIGIGIGALIVIQIAFHIVFAVSIAVREGEGAVEREIASHTLEDERDKLISLKASHIGHICMGIGLLAALACLALGIPAVAALHVLLGSCALGTLVDGGVSVYLYERGMLHG